MLGKKRGPQPNLARDSYEHEFISRPNVKVVRRNAKARLKAGATRLHDWVDLKLTPQGVDVFLLVVHSRELHEVISNSGVSSISSEHKVKLNLDLFCAIQRAARLTNFKPGLALLEICAGKLVVEEELDIGHSLENVQQPLVKTTPVNSKYCLSRRCQRNDTT